MQSPFKSRFQQTRSQFQSGLQQMQRHFAAFLIRITADSVSLFQTRLQQMQSHFQFRQQQIQWFFQSRLQLMQSPVYMCNQDYSRYSLSSNEIRIIADAATFPIQIKSRYRIQQKQFPLSNTDYSKCSLFPIQIKADAVSFLLLNYWTTVFSLAGGGVLRRAGWDNSGQWTPRRRGIRPIGGEPGACNDDAWPRRGQVNEANVCPNNRQLTRPLVQPFAFRGQPIWGGGGAH